MSNGYRYGCGGKRQGMGEGMGRGRGRRGGGGGARGHGMGRGRGGGRGPARGQGFMPLAGSSSPALEPRDALRQTQGLKAQARDIGDQLRAITHTIAETEPTSTSAPAPTTRQSRTASNQETRCRKMTAVIDQERCLLCGLCVDVCPEQAISMDDTVAIDPSKCTGCGSCVDECPNDSISLSEMAPRAAS